MPPPPQSFDPGLTQQYAGNLRRAINKDGSFNVHRRGGRLQNANLYLWLTSMPWAWFFVLLFGAYTVVNLLFAGVYFAIGIDHLAGADIADTGHAFLSAFFFSSHTLTTVGYGSIYPRGLTANIIASFEALLGLLGFAVATGLLYGRVSRPSARIAFSDSILIAPYRDNLSSLQFRVANQRTNILVDIEAKILLMTVTESDGQPRRTYTPLALERERVYFLPLTWTVVHPIDQESPLFHLTAEDCQRLQAEFLIFIKAFDDTFSQTVHARYSYRYDEMVWHARFQPAFTVDPGGDLVLELDQLSHFQSPGETSAK